MSEPAERSEAGDQARVSVTVRVPIETAFELFTGQIDRWWRRGPRFRQAGAAGGFVHIEPGVGGRIFESIDHEGGAGVFEIGRISAWDPPNRFVFSWRNANFAPNETTEVEVNFRDTRGNTTVEVTHRGWSGLPRDHPARHGLHGAAFARMIGLWWADQMSSLRQLAEPASDSARRAGRS